MANEALYDLSAKYADTIIAPSPVALMKAVKNETEQAGFRKAMERDGVAMVKFLRWVKEAVPAGNETELSIDKKLYEEMSHTSSEIFKSTFTAAVYAENIDNIYLNLGGKNNG